MGKKVNRLFEQFQPENYQLRLTPNIDELTFSGSVVITGKKVGRPSQRLTLHQKDLKITSAKVTKHDKHGANKIKISRVNNQDSLHEVRIHSDEMIYPGKYQIELDFYGKITKNMTGIYPCYFDIDEKQADSTRKVMLATQFESHHAREAFPCVDEPEAKATFDLSLTTAKNLTVLSNTLPTAEKIIGKNKITKFEKTPIMSSYLLAFVIGNIHCVEGKSKSGITMRSWGHAGQPKKFLEYANKEAVQIIDFFEAYFDTPFPLKKCDQIALPDFESGAMENWGLITYREVAMLADPDNRSVSAEQYVSMVIAHELSHQWFGNLVTMKWWDDLWLNESFASMVEHIALDHLHPEWNQWENYASSDIIACSNRDIYKDVQSVRVDVNHPDEIHTLFDGAIVYAKGGRLLKMLLDHIGEDNFRKGLKHYFKTHEYGNTTRDDLWDSLAEASNIDVTSFMNPWLEQSGMPVLSVKNQGARIELSQERFVLDAENDKSLWPIPLFAEPKLETDLLKKKNLAIRAPAQPVLINKTGSGHYLVKYEDASQKSHLAKSLSTQSIPAEARINAINDLLLLTKRGDTSIVDALEIVKTMGKEPRDAVWGIMARAVGLAAVLSEGDDSLEAAIKKFKLNLSEYWYKKLGWDDKKDDEPNTQLLRTTAISFMVGGESEDAIGHALRLYKSTSIEELPSEQRGIVLGAAVRHDGSDRVINGLTEKYKSSQNPDLQMAIAGALTHTKDGKVAKRLLAEGLSNHGFVRPQDVFRWFAYLMRNRYTRELAWEWVTSEWDRLDKEFGQGKSLDTFVLYSASPLHTKKWQKKFADFFTPKLNQIVLKRNIAVGLSEVEARVAWHDRDLPKLKAYFKD